MHDWLLSYVVKKSPHCEELRLAWFGDPDPVVASAGWALTTDRVAIDIGERLRALVDYPTPPDCTSPFAPIWITEIVRRQQNAYAPRRREAELDAAAATETPLTVRSPGASLALATGPGSGWRRRGRTDR